MAIKDKQHPLPLGQTVVSPGLMNDPAVQNYLRTRGAVGESTAQTLPGHSMPVAGGAAPRIPSLLNSATDGNKTMSDYARGMGSPPPGMVFPPEKALLNGLQANDRLPDEARSDPGYRLGMGSDLAVNQPSLALKYGVIRGGERLMPQQLQTGRPPGLREETVRGLNAFAEMASQQPATPVPPPTFEVGKPKTEEEEEKKKKPEKEGLDEFEMMRLREVMNDILASNEQREVVEKRCKPLNIEDLIIHGVATQDVPIVVDLKTGEAKFVPTFRSMSAQEDLSLKLLLMKEAKALDLRGAYFDEKFALMGTCASTVAINGKPLPDFLDGQWNFNEDLFWAKFNKFIRFPLHMLGSLGVHAYWFDQRVRRLFRAEEVKNG